MEWAAIALLATAGLVVFMRGAGWAEALLAGVALAWIGGGLFLRANAPPPAGSPGDPASAERPLQTDGRGYVSSDTCRSCHPVEYASWKHSYHRSMTQVVTPETMLADWDGTEIDIRETYRLEVEGDQYWVDMVDPDFQRSRLLRKKLVAGDNVTRRIRRRVVQATGSHHQQVFWFSSGNERELLLLPFTWLVPQKRWVPYEFTLLRPVSRQLVTLEWNRICIVCHATAGQPRPIPNSPNLDTHVAELGIACEACHGPAEAHVARNQNPIRRYLQHASEPDGSEIVNPAKLDALRSTQICGQCHSQHNAKGREEALITSRNGSSYRPGDDLDLTKEFYRRPSNAGPLGTSVRFQADSVTWPDGMIRTTGRDYHGVLDSPCFAGDEFSCLSCHAMHGYESRVDQLAPGMDGPKACVQCHGEFESVAEVAMHTHHEADSSGSLCYNCHMPHTTYGLLKGVRSHTVSSPNLRESVEHGRPNACNLCHLDQTLAWTGEHLTSWYGQRPQLPEGTELSRRSAAVDWLLEGDAAQRALIASAMSRTAAHDASGFKWMPPLLARLLDDPYPAVRLIVEHTLGSFPGFEDVPLATARALGRPGVLARWKRSPGSAGPGMRVYQKPSGAFDTEAIEAALSRRDDRPINIAE